MTVPDVLLGFKKLVHPSFKLYVCQKICKCRSSLICKIITIKYATPNFYMQNSALRLSIFCRLGLCIYMHRQAAQFTDDDVYLWDPNVAAT